MEIKIQGKPAVIATWPVAEGGIYLRKAMREKIDTELQELFRLKTQIRTRGFIS